MTLEFTLRMVLPHSLLLRDEPLRAEAEKALPEVGPDEPPVSLLGMDTSSEEDGEEDWIRTTAYFRYEIRSLRPHHELLHFANDVQFELASHFDVPPDDVEMM
jgi:hypothetical protein